MGRRKTARKRPRKGVLSHVVSVLWAADDYGEASFYSASRRIATAFLRMPGIHSRQDGTAGLLGELDHVPLVDAERWIRRVRERDHLASILLTDVLAMLARCAAAIGEDRRQVFPTPECKRELTMNLGRYLVEFEVPTGAAFKYWYDEMTEFGPGFRGVAFVERCHLSSSWHPECYGCGIIPGFGRCPGLLGFNVPCMLYLHARIEGTRPVCEPGKEPLRVAVEVPFHFIVGWRTTDMWGTYAGPLVPKLGLGAMLGLIEEVAREAGSDDEGDGPGSE